MSRKLAVTLFALAVALVGCDKKTGKTEPRAAGVKTAPAAVEKTTPAVAPVAAAKPAGEAGCACGKPHGQGECGQGECGKHAEPAEPAKAAHAGHGEEGHSCGGSEPPESQPEERKGADGQEIIHGGDEFSDAPEVTVAAILEKPDEYKGKRIKLKGDISAMCHHKRSWFAMVAGDKSGRQVRVLTMPKFQVPSESIGKTALAEGVVEVVEVPRAHAVHLAKGHKLADPGAGSGPIKRVVLRANAADFMD